MTILENNVLFIFLTLLALLTLMIFIAVVYARKVTKQKKLLEEKDEKITFLRKINASNEHTFTQREHVLEKEVLALQHTVDTLEHEMKDGTKNQVVLKMESLQHKREKMLKRSNLSQE